MKHRYYNILAVCSFVIIVICLLSGFINRDPGHVAESLVKHRSQILHRTLSGELPLQEAEKQLRQIEGETLLAQDLEMLKKNGHRAEESEKPYFKSITKKKKLFHYITYEAEILWNSGNTVTGGVYNIVLKDDSGRFILTILETAKL